MKAEINMKKSIAAFLKDIISVFVVLVFVIAISGCQKEEARHLTALPLRRPVHRRQFEALEAEAGRYRAADQRPVA